MTVNASRESFQDVLKRVCLYDLNLPSDVNVIDQLTAFVWEDFQQANIQDDADRVILENESLMDRDPPDLSYYDRFKIENNYPAYINAIQSAKRPTGIRPLPATTINPSFSSPNIQPAAPPSPQNTFPSSNIQPPPRNTFPSLNVQPVPPPARNTLPFVQPTLLSTEPSPRSSSKPLPIPITPPNMNSTPSMYGTLPIVRNKRSVRWRNPIEQQNDNDSSSDASTDSDTDSDSE